MATSPEWRRSRLMPQSGGKRMSEAGSEMGVHSTRHIVKVLLTTTNTQTSAWGKWKLLQLHQVLFQEWGREQGILLAASGAEPVLQRAPLVQVGNRIRTAECTVRWQNNKQTSVITTTCTGDIIASEAKITESKATNTVRDTDKHWLAIELINKHWKT